MVSIPDWLAASAATPEASLAEIAVQLKRIADRLEVQFPTEAEKRAELDARQVRMYKT